MGIAICTPAVGAALWFGAFGAILAVGVAVPVEDATHIRQLPDCTLGFPDDAHAPPTENPEQGALGVDEPLGSPTGKNNACGDCPLPAGIAGATV